MFDLGPSCSTFLSIMYIVIIIRHGALIVLYTMRIAFSLSIYRGILLPYQFFKLYVYYIRILESSIIL